MILVIVDAAQAKRLTAKRPPSLAKTTTVDHVPHPVPLHQPWRTPRVTAALDALLPSQLRDTAMREQLYKELNHAAGSPWRPHVVQAVVLAAAAAPELPIMIPSSFAPTWSVTLGEWAKAAAILSAIPGFIVSMNGGVCCFRSGLESGLIARCDTARFKRFVEEVIARAPSTMEDFYSVRPV